MFAVIKTGGKQYRVAADQQIVIEKLEGEAGDTLVFGEVLMIGDGDKVDIGAPCSPALRLSAKWSNKPVARRSSPTRRSRVTRTAASSATVRSLTVIKITDILAKGGAVAKKSDRAPEPKAEAAAPAKKPRLPPRRKLKQLRPRPPPRKPRPRRPSSFTAARPHRLNARLRPRTKGGLVGPQESRRLYSQRPRLELQAPRRETLRR